MKDNTRGEVAYRAIFTMKKIALCITIFFLAYSVSTQEQEGETETSKKKGGQVCLINSECETEVCVITFFIGVCTEGSIGSICLNDINCNVGYCDNQRQLANKSNHGICSNPIGLGERCLLVQKCETGLFCVGSVCSNGDINSSCATDADCKKGLSCSARVCS